MRRVVTKSEVTSLNLKAISGLTELGPTCKIHTAFPSNLVTNQFESVVDLPMKEAREIEHVGHDVTGSQRVGYEIQTRYTNNCHSAACKFHCSRK